MENEVDGEVVFMLNLAKGLQYLTRSLRSLQRIEGEDIEEAGYYFDKAVEIASDACGVSED